MSRENQRMVDASVKQMRRQEDINATLGAIVSGIMGFLFPAAMVVMWLIGIG